MVSRSISKEDYNNLERLVLEDDIFNSEAELYIYKNKYILKKLYNDMDLVYKNKIFTIKELIANKDIIDIDELVMPLEFIKIDNVIEGFIQPYINNINFKTVLNSKDITNSKKIDYFKEIGIILKKMEQVRDKTKIKDFYLNDIHECNFILNNDTGKINVVDMDSCKINNNYASPSIYLNPFSNINSVSKYKNISSTSLYDETFKIDSNTEYYCYIVMILNYLYNSKITRLNKSMYYNYLEYLKKLGISYELLDKLKNIYNPDINNLNIYEYLDELKNLDYKSNEQEFKKYMKIK